MLKIAKLLAHISLKTKSLFSYSTRIITFKYPQHSRQRLQEKNFVNSILNATTLQISHITIDIHATILKILQ